MYGGRSGGNSSRISSNTSCGTIRSTPRPRAAIIASPMPFTHLNEGSPFRRAEMVSGYGSPTAINSIGAPLMWQRYRARECSEPSVCEAPKADSTSGSARAGHGPESPVRVDGDRHVTVQVRTPHQHPGPAQQVQGRRRRMPVVVVHTHRDNREPSTEAPDQVLVLLAAAVVRDLEDVHVQVRVV